MVLEMKKYEPFDVLQLFRSIIAFIKPAQLVVLFTGMSDYFD